MEKELKELLISFFDKNEDLKKYIETGNWDIFWEALSDTFEKFSNGVFYCFKNGRYSLSDIKTFFLELFYKAGVNCDMTIIPSLFCRGARTLTLYLPKTVKTIEYGAFSSCGFEKIIFPDGLKTIGNSAFRGNIYLKEVILPDTVKDVEAGAFAECHRLKKLVVPKKCKVGNSAIDHCSYLEELTLPAKYKNKYDDSKACDSLGIVDYRGVKISWV